MVLMPGFYCGTASGVFPVEYCDVPDVKIYPPRTFINTLQKLKPGKKIYGEFNIQDLPVLMAVYSPVLIKEGNNHV